MIGELTNLILVIGESWGVYTPPPIYTRDIFQHTLREDLTINYNNEFEAIFIEIDDNMHTMLIGEIYRVPGTSVQFNGQYSAISPYYTLFQPLTGTS